MWKCLVSKSKRPAILTKRSEASGWRRSSRQEWPTSPTWCAGTLSTSPSSATGGHFRPKTLIRGSIFQGKDWDERVGEARHQCFKSEAKSWNLEAKIFWGNQKTITSIGHTTIPTITINKIVVTLTINMTRLTGLSFTLCGTTSPGPSSSWAGWPGLSSFEEQASCEEEPGL